MHSKRLPNLAAYLREVGDLDLPTPIRRTIHRRRQMWVFCSDVYAARDAASALGRIWTDTSLPVRVRGQVRAVYALAYYMARSMDAQVGEDMRMEAERRAWLMERVCRRWFKSRDPLAYYSLGGSKKNPW